MPAIPPPWDESGPPNGWRVGGNGFWTGPAIPPGGPFPLLSNPGSGEQASIGTTIDTPWGEIEIEQITGGIPHEEIELGPYIFPDDPSGLGKKAVEDYAHRMRHRNLLLSRVRVRPGPAANQGVIDRIRREDAEARAAANPAPAGSTETATDNRSWWQKGWDWVSGVIASPLGQVLGVVGFALGVGVALIAGAPIAAALGIGFLIGWGATLLGGAYDVATGGGHGRATSDFAACNCGPRPSSPLTPPS